MTDISLRSLFAYASGQPYAITNSFDGPDLLNGGTHRATDVGNFGMNDPILAPADCIARGLRHFDSALGIEYDLGQPWTLELWHLNSTQEVPIIAGRSTVGTWRAVAKGQQTGTTGNSGARLPNGSPMPAHTHIVLKRDAVPVDAEPYLLGAPLIGDDNPVYNPADVLALYGTQIRALPGANVRSGPSTAEPVIANFAQGYSPLRAVAKVKGSIAAGSPDWYAFWVETEGKTRVAYMHSSAVVELLAPPPTGFTQAQVDAARAEGTSIGFSRAKTKAAAAVGAIEP